MVDAAATTGNVAGTPRQLVSGGRRLEWHLARPPSSAARDATRTGLVVAHALPTGPGAAATAAYTLPELADRMARETGWAALSFSFRGAGRSPGSFSPSAWLEDLEAAVAFLRSEVSTVWLAGFGFGGTLALRLAALDGDIGGVAVLATPSDLSPWAADPAALAASVHEAGFADTAEPEGLETWEADLRAIDPLGSAASIPPRPLLIVHGSADQEVPLVDARALADAAEGNGDLRVVATAGHRLRHDPRVIAILLGWLERRES
jgi:uncharacterized protein